MEYTIIRLREIRSLAQAAQDPKGVWVDDAFEGVITNAVDGAGRKPAKAMLTDREDGASATISLFGGGNLRSYENKLVRVAGKGNRAKLYNGAIDISLGKTHEIEVLSNVQAGTTPPRQAADDRRGGGSGPQPTGSPSAKPATNAPPAGAERDPAAIFHKNMQEIGLLLLHAHQYAADLTLRLGLTAEEKDRAVTSFFLTGKERGLLGMPIPPRKALPDGKGFERYVKPAADPVAIEAERKRKEEEAARVAAEEARRKAAEAAAHQENLDEDVPF